MPGPFPNPGAVPGPVRDVVGYNGKPPKVTWPGGARIAISLVVNYEEGSELAVGDGDGLTERARSNAIARRRARSAAAGTMSCRTAIAGRT